MLCSHAARSSSHFYTRAQRKVRLHRAAASTANSQSSACTSACTVQHARLYESYRSRLSLQRHATYNTQHATCTVVREAAVCLYNGMQHTIHSMQHATRMSDSHVSLKQHTTWNMQHTACNTRWCRRRRLSLALNRSSAPSARTAQHSTAQHSTAQHSTAQHSTDR